MSKATITVRYDGPDLSTHQMDVADLAPALLAISELCKIANKKFNSDRAGVRVLISTDEEQNCFQFDLTVIQSVWDTAKALVSDADVKTALEILTWLGIINGGGYGLLKLIAWTKNRPVESTKIIQNAGRDFVQVTIQGDVVVAYPEALEMLSDQAVIKNVKKIVEPVTKAGYEMVEFDFDRTRQERIEKVEAEVIVAARPANENESAAEEPQEITAWVTVYAPVYDKNSERWRFTFGDGHEYMDISETDIAVRAVERGGAMMHDAYRVRLEIRQAMSDKSKFSTTYKIKEVLDFKAAPQQRALDYRDPNGEQPS